MQNRHICFDFAREMLRSSRYYLPNNDYSRYFILYITI